MSLPGMTGELLPPCAALAPYPATLAEVSDRFVDVAPHSEARSCLFRMLDAYAGLVWSILPNARLWVDGGFVTHKTWAPPGDIDVVIVANFDEASTLTSDQQERLTTLVTLQGVTAQSPEFRAARIQPMGGMIDGFIIVDDGAEGGRAQMAHWFDLWTRVKGPQGPLDPSHRKGFVEVVNPDA